MLYLIHNWATSFAHSPRAKNCAGGCQPFNRIEIDEFANLWLASMSVSSLANDASRKDDLLGDFLFFAYLSAYQGSCHS